MDLDRPVDIDAADSPPPWSRERVCALGVTTDLLTAAAILRVKRTKAYRLAKTGTFPVPVVRIGRTYVVAVAHLVDLLGLDTRPSQ